MAFSVLDPPPGAPEHEKKILLRHYMVRLKKSGTKLPRVVLEEIGPSADLVLDRAKAAEPTMWKASLKVPKEVKKKKVKNVTTDTLGTKREARQAPESGGRVVSAPICWHITAWRRL